MSQKNQKGDRKEEKTQGDPNEVRWQLHDRWRWIEERIGEKEWKRLVFWRKVMLLCYTLTTLAYLFFIIMLVGFLFRVGTNLFVGRPLADDLEVGLRQMLAVGAMLLFWLCGHLVKSRLAGQLQRLEWQGHSPAAIEDALWHEHQQRLVEEHGSDILNTFEEDALQPAAPWWKVELSGVHLAYWVSVVILLGFFALGAQTVSFARAFSLAAGVMGTILKAVFWALWFIMPAAGRRQLWQTYAYLGSFRSAAGLAAAGLLALYAITYVLVPIIGWVRG